ncbi:ATP-dependent RNA helicase SPB4 Ecym_7324 [Eremothecium cymbalariae DBVPG|uniref:ATP-dependent RNA helicase n=1 Tax=Eremothecium cymbalariae (strain CBS 270.75 / DBVPG 7215 / KCTC 17166 / NRRL Y-17582) TaxID=931890 RepID=G8JWE3_ERECY|nr:hypothetical protein Ecym_7324 [Eremothecium cymbalariae DBVPG\
MSQSLTWDSLEYELQPWIKLAVEAMGFEAMTPVQASTIPLFAGNKDVVVESVTGSGKTVAFVIPILEKIIKDGANSAAFRKGHFHSLIVSPTRELASQIQLVVQSFLNYYPDNCYPIRSQIIVGTNQVTVRDDVAEFMQNRPQILIGTPGRLLDFLKMVGVKTTSCGIVVLDEADKLLDYNFGKDVDNILKFLPKQRRTGLFSATISSAGDEVFKTGMRNPVKISVKSHKKAPQSLKMNYVVVEPEKKFELLLSILNYYRFKKCIVYLPTCISVTYFYAIIQHLTKLGQMDEDLKIYSLHGKLQTTSRMKTLEKFTQDLNKSVLLTTDVAARGIDIPNIDLVLQMDPPTDTDIFLHRCGRTGRANRVGKAIVLLNAGREEDYIPFLHVKNIELERTEISCKPIPGFNTIIKDWILEDRARFDLSIKVYVGFIRHYSKHTASSIFRLQTLDYVGLAKMHGLLRLPRMPEIQKYLNQDQMPEEGWLIMPPINLATFAYADKQKEKARLQALKNTNEIIDKRKLKSQLKKNMAWSNKTTTKENKVERKTKLAQKRKAIEEQLARENSNSESEIEEDWKDIVRQRKKKKVDSQLQGAFGDL